MEDQMLRDYVVGLRRAFHQKPELGHDGAFTLVEQPGAQRQVGLLALEGLQAAGEGLQLPLRLRLLFRHHAVQCLRRLTGEKREGLVQRKAQLMVPADAVQPFEIAGLIAPGGAVLLALRNQKAVLLIKPQGLGRDAEALCQRADFIVHEITTILPRRRECAAEEGEKLRGSQSAYALNYIVSLRNFKAKRK